MFVKQNSSGKPKQNTHELFSEHSTDSWNLKGNSDIGIISMLFTLLTSSYRIS